MPVSRDAGRFLYGVASSINAKRIVEFGSSFGISAITSRLVCAITAAAK